MWRRFVVNREKVELPAKSFADMPFAKIRRRCRYTCICSENKFSAVEFAVAFLAPMGEISGDVPKTFKNDDPESGP